MVYCTKCGAQNPDDAKVCSNCGASLYRVGEKQGEHYEPYRRMEHECFGVPGGGIILLVALGLIILLAGLIGILQQLGYLSSEVTVWPLVLIIFGVLIIIAAMYGISRRRW
jgi:uncharacterized membrane protein YvbJ